jgi:hypothetical protein
MQLSSQSDWSKSAFTHLQQLRKVAPGVHVPKDMAQSKPNCNWKGPRTKWRELARKVAISRPTAQNQ